MTTINDVEFNMKSMTIVSVHRNIKSPLAGRATSHISDMGYDGLNLRVTGFETTLSDYDTVVAAFMSTGEHTLVYRDGWQFKIYSAQFNPTLQQSKPNYYPYTITLITSTPYTESTTTTTSTKTLNTDGETWTQSNSAVNITTDGTVDAVPDIQIQSTGTSVINVAQILTF